ncbi:peptidase S9 [Nitrospira sp. KM1]|uniref:alpha/beta hydrolase family protein n=1 Tax=Nitrospira sp. KM1 TaxID=1936990 RepID=UPI0013A7A999|nr:S9 family peptidase [Nitrospira sp. KM1]BCA53962.1 peptidase S9 [Nitrospira sp. KM1]
MLGSLLEGCSSYEQIISEPLPLETGNSISGRLPIKSFASLPLIQSMKLSPSGTHLASIQNIGTKTYVVTSTHDGKNLKRILESENKTFSVRWFEWFDDERLLVSVMVADVRRDTAVHHKWVQTRLFAINRDGSNLKTDLVTPEVDPLRGQPDHLPQLQDGMIGRIPGDSRSILIALDFKTPTYPDVYKLDVYTGERELVERNIYGIRTWVADRQGVVRLGVAVEGTTIHYLVKIPGRDSWQTLRKFDVEREAGLAPLGFDEDPNILYVKQDLDGRSAVYRMDLSNLESPPALLASHAVYDVNGSLIYAPWLKRAVGLQYDADTSKNTYWSADVETLHARVNVALPGRANIIYSSSHDGLRHLVTSEHATQPRQWYLLDEPSNRLIWIADAYPDLNPKVLAEPAPLTVKARDGTILHGYFTKPPGRNVRRPLILFPHGGPVYRDDRSFDYWTQFFVSRGWSVLQVNFRGSSGYGREFMEAGFKRWGLEMQDDLTDSVQQVVARGLADPNRICIVGGSYGGYAALMGIAKTPDAYRCAVSFAGVSDLQFLLQQNIHNVNYRIGWERQLGSAWSDRARLNATSPINHVEKIRTPLLMMHGAEDRVVLVEQSREMAVALKKAGNTNFRYVEFPDGDHHLSRAEDRIRVFNEMEKFLATHLDGPLTAARAGLAH